MSWNHPRLKMLIAWLWIASITLVVYSDSFTVPCIFDDMSSINANPNIRSLTPIWKCMTVDRPTTISGRPIIGLSLAINYAISGDKVWSYHAMNVLLHLACSLLLLLLLVRIFASEAAPARIRPFAHGLALSVVFIWSIHPLLTESVIYIIQRTELMVVFFYLATLYCTARAFESSGGRRGAWMALGVVSCALGMGSKEVMISAPLAVLIYDRLFLHRAWLKGLRAWWVYYACLLATTGILGAIMATSPRAGSAGFGLGVSGLHYLYTQAGIIVNYVKLAFFPWPLNVLYDVPLTRTLWGAALPGGAILVCIGLTIYGLARGRAGAMAGAVFFMVLAPSSSFVPIVTEIVAERRMYLPLAAVLAVVAGVLCNAYVMLRERWPGAAGAPWAIGGATLTVAAFFAPLSYERSQDYRTDEAIWRDTAAKSPLHPTPLNNLGVAYNEKGRNREAAGALAHAMGLKSEIPELFEKYVAAASNYSLVLGALGDLDRSRDVAERVISIQPGDARARMSLAIYELLKGNYPRALEQIDEGIKADGSVSAAWATRCRILVHLKRLDEAAEALGRAAWLDVHAPLNVVAASEVVEAGGAAVSAALPALRRLAAAQSGRTDLRRLLARALAEMGRLAESAEEFEGLIAAEPGNAVAWTDYSAVLARMGRNAEMVRALEHIVGLSPRDASARTRLGDGLARMGRAPEAETQWRAAIELDPRAMDARISLARTAFAAGNVEAAAAQLRAILEIDPTNLAVRSALTGALVRVGRSDEAVAVARRGVVARPGALEPTLALAHLLAAAPGLSAGARSEALAMAQQLNQQTSGQAPQVLDVLAIAQAATGDFASALATAARAADAANAAGLAQLVPAIRERVSLFQARRPYLMPQGMPTR